MTDENSLKGDTTPPTIIIIMGARVKENGQPSGAMIRRVEAAVLEGKSNKGTTYLVTGGVGESGYSEAQIMSEMLVNAGISKEQIIQEDVSIDTLASVINCARLLKKMDFIQSIKISTDRYHLPRCIWLFYLNGISVQGVKVESGIKANGLPKWAYYYFREFVAICWDTLLMGLKNILLFLSPK